MGTNHRICDFLNFSAWCNNSKDCRISGMFSALGASRKVVDTFFDSSYSLGRIVQYAISQIFQRGVIIPKIVAFQACSLHWDHLEKWLMQFLNPLNHWAQLYDVQFHEFFNMVEWFPWNDISLLGKSRLGSSRDEWQFIGEIRIYLSRWSSHKGESGVNLVGQVSSALLC